MNNLAIKERDHGWRSFVAVGRSARGDLAALPDFLAAA
jgi:hypothetical protein